LFSYVCFGYGDSLRAGRPSDRIPVGRDFPHPSRPALEPTQPPIKWIPGLCRGVKRPGRGVDDPLSSAEVKERVVLYIYSPRAFVACSRVNMILFWLRSCLKTHGNRRMINLLELCVLYMGRAHRYPQHTPFFIFFQQIHVLNFLNMLHTLQFFLFKMPFIS
jgi:hypothetical protein